MSETIERPYILHMFTATPQMSPFDVNMAADAGYQVIVPYCGVEAGMVAINQVRMTWPDAPFGGMKESGFGSEDGPEGIMAHMTTKAVHIA